MMASLKLLALFCFTLLITTTASATFVTSEWLDTNTQEISWGGNTNPVNPAIAANDENVFIVWSDSVDFNGAGTDNDIFFTHMPLSEMDKNGTNWVDYNIEIISIRSTSNSLNPDIAINDGNVFIVWEDFGINQAGSAGQSDIFLKVLPFTELQGTNAWGDVNAQVVSTESTSAARFPSIAVNDVNIFIVWDDSTPYAGSDAAGDILFKHIPIIELYEGSGDINHLADHNTHIVMDTDGESDYPEIAINDSNIFVVWEDGGEFAEAYENTSTDILFKSIPFTELGKSSLWWDVNAQVVSIESTRETSKPKIAVNDENAFIIWNDKTEFAEAYESSTTITTDLFLKIISVDEIEGNSIFADENTHVVSTDSSNSYPCSYQDIAVNDSNVFITYIQNGLNLKNATMDHISGGNGNWEDINALKISTDRPGDVQHPTIALTDFNIYLSWSNTGGSSEKFIGFKHATLLENQGPDVNVLFPSAALYSHSYVRDGNLMISFNASDADDDQLYVDIYYSTSKNGRENLIERAVDLQSIAASPTADLNCTSTDFSTSNKCYYNLDTRKGYIQDGNFFIDVVLYDGNYTVGLDFSDNNFLIDNTPFKALSDVNVGTRITDQNVHLYCGDDVNYTVPDENSDCYRIPGSTICNSVAGFGDATNLGAPDANLYLRWRLEVPSNSTILRSMIKNYANCDSGGCTTNFTSKIHFLDDADVNSFETGNPETISLGDDVNYILDETWVNNISYFTPDLNAIVQSYVEKSGYESGSHLGVKFSRGDATTNEFRLVRTLEDLKPAELYITYGLENGVGNCRDINYRLDTDSEGRISYGPWQAYDPAAGIPISAEGTWAIDFNVVDALGNQSDSNTIQVRIDKTPNVAIINPASNAQTNSSEVTFRYEPEGEWITPTTYWVNIDGKGWVNNGLSLSYPVEGLSSGSHTFEVYVTDADTGDSPVEKSILTVDFSAPPLCGSGVCDPGESAANCPQDCAQRCGDGACTHTENPLNCPEDCIAACGDKVCSSNETCKNCPADCGACGDETSDNETKSPEEERPPSHDACSGLNCNDNNPCTLDRCFEGSCFHVEQDDGTTCGFGMECKAGACKSAFVAAGMEQGGLVEVIFSALLFAITTIGGDALAKAPLVFGLLIILAVVAAYLTYTKFDKFIYAQTSAQTTREKALMQVVKGIAALIAFLLPLAVNLTLGVFEATVFVIIEIALLLVAEYVIKIKSKRDAIKVD